MKRIALFTALFLVIVVGAVPVLAQVAGRISGSVVDSTGAAIPNAKVSLVLPGGTAPIIATETTSEGLYVIATVRPDYYDIVIEAPGFDKLTMTRVKVDASKETSFPPTELKIAATSTVVDVMASAGMVQTSNAEVAVTISRSQVDNLPVLDRQVNYLFNTQAGVTSARTATTINGLRPSYTNLLLDGINVQDSVRTNPLDYVPNRLTIGQISEITLATSNVNPTIGGNATTISLTTPSGTNEYHGNAYWYNRNGAASANDWFNNQSRIDKPFLNLNQIGGSIGGPAIKDKLLFYSNYEAFRLRQTTPTQRTILTPEARQGILRYRSTPGGPVQSFNVMTGQQTPIDPYVQGLLAQVPAEGNFSGLGDGLNTTGYSFNARNNTTRDNITGKVDYYLSPRNALSGSYIFNRDLQDRPTSGSFYTVEPPIYNDNSAHFVSAGWRWNPSPTMTNELRGGFNRLDGTFKRRTDVPAFFAANNANSLPLIFNSPVNETMPEARNTYTYSLQDNATWVRGKHSLAFGFQATLWRTQVLGYAGTVPTYTLSVNSANIPQGFGVGDIPGASATDVNTANRLLAGLGGLISHSTRTFNINSPTSGFVPGVPYNYNLNMNNLAPYFNDTWKVRRNLTVNLGLRYEYFSPVYEPNGLYIQPRTPSGNVVEALLGNPTIDFVPGGMYNKDLNNWAPNVGFAWDVLGNGRTSVRGGYSIGYANDNHINSSWITYTSNNGLSIARAAANLNGRTSGGLPPIATPPFALPTTLQDQFNLSPSSAPIQGVIDPSLSMPYTQQWNVGIEHEWNGYVFSGRYIGNNTTGQLRQIDYNQINVFQDTFLEDFKTARANGFLAQRQLGRFDPRYNSAIAGSRPLPFFDKLPRGALLTNTSVVNTILSGEVGTLAQTYQSNLLFPSPGFSYFPNPLALYSSLLTNAARSSYNGGQFEVIRRLRGGMQFQANYTFAKALSTAGAFRGLEAQLDNNNRSLERARATYDLAHAFKVNHYVPLPFGTGQKFAVGNRILDRIVSGWALSGFLVIQSGQPVSVLSNRGTFNRGARSVGVATANTSATGSELRSATGLYKTGNGVYWIDPQHIGADGRGVAPDGQAPFSGQLFANPGPGEVGTLQRRYLDGPGFWNYNFSVQKDTRITERQSLQFRVDFYNLFNHPNFWPSADLASGDHTINSATFGRITGMASGGDTISSRIIQAGLFYRF